MVRRHGSKELRASEQDAHSGGTVEFVRRTHIEVASNGADINVHMLHGLCSVHQRCNASTACERTDRGHVVDRAEYVRDVSDSKQTNVRSHQGIQRVHIKRAVVEHRHGANGSANRLSQHLPWNDVCVMFHFRDKDHVSLTYSGTPPGGGDEVDTLRRPLGEHNLARISSQKVRHARAGTLEPFGGLRCQDMRATMDIAVVTLVEASNGIQHSVWFHRRACTVKVDQRTIVVNSSRKDRECSPNGLDVERRCHASASSTSATRWSRTASSSRWSRTSAAKACVSSVRASASETPRARR